MNTLNLTSYETPIDNAVAYINCLHNSVRSSNVAMNYLYLDGAKSEPIYGTYDKLVSVIKNNYEINKYNEMFVTVNSLNPYITNHAFKRSICNLFGFDNIMIDIDAVSGKKDHVLLGQEDFLMNELQEAWRNGDFPIPNAFSYTGTGGVHLYYTIEYLPKTMKKAIKALKYLLAGKIQSCLDDIESSYGMEWKVDTKVFDEMRIDRLPGSINKKTGIMCQFFTTNAKRYTFKQLLGHNDIDNIDWDTLKQAAIHNLKLKARKSIDPSTYTKKTNKKSANNKKGTPVNLYEPKQLAQNRIDGLFSLAESGYDFDGHRETSCFYLRVNALVLEMPEDETLKLVRKLNTYFQDPLPESELTTTSQARRVYRFSNETAANYLGIELDSDEGRIAFGKHSKAKTVVINGLTSSQEKKAQKFIDIAKIKCANKEFSARDIANALSNKYSYDQVKKINTLFNKDMSLCQKLSTCTIDNDYAFLSDVVNNNVVNPYSVKKKKTDEPDLLSGKRLLVTFDELVAHIRKSKIMNRNSKRASCYVPEFEAVVVMIESVMDTSIVNYRYGQNMLSLCKLLKEAAHNKIFRYKKNSDNEDRFVWSKNRSMRATVIGWVVSILYYSNTYYSSMGAKWERIKTNSLPKEKEGRHSNSCAESIKSFLLTCLIRMGVKRYYAFNLVYGYFSYSYDYEMDIIDNYYSEIDKLEFAKPQTVPLFADELRKFPDRVKTTMFFFRPEILEYQHYDVPLPYDQQYKEIHSLIDDFNYQKKCYKKFAKHWDVDLANEAVSNAELINQNIHDAIDAYRPFRDLHLNYFACKGFGMNSNIVKPYLEFDPYEANITVLRRFIAKSKTTNTNTSTQTFSPVTQAAS